MRFPMRGIPIGALLLVVLSGTGCLDNPGITPPEREFSFPVAGRLWPDAAPTHLLVANSNFDLRYNGGTLATWALAPLDACLAQCANPGDDCFLRDGDALGHDDVACPGLFQSEVVIDSFAADLALSPTEDRVYVPVRSGSKLCRVDLNAGGVLSCGPGRVCDGAHQGVDDAEARTRDLSFPADPIGIYVGSAAADLGLPASSGDYIVLSHREGATSLLAATADAAPTLLDVHEGFAPDLAAITRDPATGLMWIPSASRPALDRAGIALNDPNALSQGFVYDAGSLALRGVDTGAAGFADTRQVVFDPRGKRAAYILSRRPRALFVVAPDESVDRLELVAQVNLGSGPSRLTVREMRAGSADAHTLAYVSCFDSRDVYIIDVDTARLVSVYRGVSGPFDLAVDTTSERLYITDFRASVIRIVDLKPMLNCLDSTGSGETEGECTPAQLGMIGRPRALVELR